MEKDKLSQKKFRWNTKIMLAIGILLSFFGGIIYGAAIAIIVLPFALIVVGAVAFVVGSFLVAKGCYIEKLNAIGKPTTSIKSIDIGEKYQVLSVVISDEPFEDKERKVYLLLQKENTEDVFFYQRKKGEEPKLLPETGDIIIPVKDEFIIRKNQKE